jgi:hypothetical protein
MPNILKRPMFRRGGSTSAGVGITSGMEPRRNFANGPDELQKQKMMLDYANQLKSKYAITEGQRIGDFLTAFGATGASDKPLTIGQAIGQATTGYAQLQAGRRAARDKAEAAVDAQLLKMFGNDKQQLNSFLKTLRARAQNAVNTGQYKDFKSAYEALFMPTYSDMFKRERAGISVEEEIREEVKKIEKDEIYPPDFDVTPIAKTKIAIRRGKIKLGKKGNETFSGTMRKGDIIQQGDGSTAIFNPEKPPASFRRYRTNEFYIANDGSVYQYQGSKGKGTFKRVYP